VVAGGTQAGNPIDRIREADLKADMFALASDTMRGREAGTLDELRASGWLALRAREAGLFILVAIQSTPRRKLQHCASL